MIFLTTGGSLKQCALALVTLAAIRADTDAFFNGIATFYAQGKFFFIFFVCQATIMAHNKSYKDLIKFCFDAGFSYS